MRHKVLTHRDKVSFVVTPAARRRPINWLAHLWTARCGNRGLALVEAQTVVCPFKFTMRQKSARLSFEVVDHRFVSQFQNPLREELLPEFHQAVEKDVIGGSIDEIE